MAYGDFASLLPAESYYTGPRGATDAAKVEATKKASYLSQMDQFYAQLAEMERQFDVTAGLREKYFEFETGERFEWEKEYGAGELELRGEDIEMRREIGLAGPRATTQAAQWQYKLGVEELEWKEEEAGMTKDFLEGYFDRFPGEIRY